MEHSGRIQKLDHYNKPFTKIGQYQDVTNGEYQNIQKANSLYTSVFYQFGGVEYFFSACLEICGNALLCLGALR